MIQMAIGRIRPALIIATTTVSAALTIMITAPITMTAHSQQQQQQQENYEIMITESMQGLDTSPTSCR
jgi:hypothetical protein